MNTKSRAFFSQLVRGICLVAITCIYIQCDTTKQAIGAAEDDGSSVMGTDRPSDLLVTSDDQALEARIDAILREMTLTEKIGQLALRGTSSREKGLPEALKDKVRNGGAGAFLNVMDTANIRTLQEIAVNESKHGIPLIFARDVIHGFKTIFPIPLGQAASWNPTLVEEGSRIAALEASSVGVRWTFAPMLDICQDSRWGRIAESPGEDPYLASEMSRAYVKGFQGADLSDPTRIAACAKHFLAYGAAIGGRDYNTAIISDELMQNLYLPPFEAAVEEGVATLMSSFNEVNGVPATGNKKILMDVLRGQFGFDGFVVSDWNSVTEMINHGFAADGKEAARLSGIAGMDMEMTSTAYDDYLSELIAEGAVSEEMIDFYVRNILRIKFRLGLFDQPYVPADHPGSYYQQDHLNSAKIAAIESSVLLKNDGILPLQSLSNVLLTGPLADKGREQLGTWTFDGEADPTVTPHEAMPEANFIEGLTYSRDMETSQLGEVVAAARRSDVVIVVAGEEAILSGEAHSRASIRLPGAQEAMIKELATQETPIVLVIMAGRPINITEIIDDVDAVLMMWHPGTMGGPALQEMLTGVVSPSGRLPVSWPKAAGQLPYFYNHKNTGRPAKPSSFVWIDDIPIGAWQSSLGNESHYLDIGYAPLFPFGYGLTYGSVEYGSVSASQSTLSRGGSVSLTVNVTNTSNIAISEVVQCYAHDITGRITRPIKELKRFEKVSLAAGESATVSFALDYEDFEYYDSDGVKGLEPGPIELFVGGNSDVTEKVVITVK